MVTTRVARTTTDVATAESATGAGGDTQADVVLLLAKIIARAVLAPSRHNTQPWRFRIRLGALELYADASRALSVADPSRRELVMSCGAALQNIKIALRHYGYAAEVEMLPDPGRRDLLARVRPGKRRAPSGLNESLYAAIPRRGTSRAGFLPVPAPRRLVPALQQAVELEGAWLEVVTDDARRSIVADLVAEGDRVQGADRALRRELAVWVRPTDGSSRDGVPAHAFGIPQLLSRLGPATLRYVPWGGLRAPRDRTLAMEAPLLLVVGTPGDTPRDWLAAGQALQLALLIATTQGVGAAFLNQPVQVPRLRAELRAALCVAGFPQLVLRMGYAAGTPLTPRRGVVEVLEATPAAPDTAAPL